MRGAACKTSNGVGHTAQTSDLPLPLERDYLVLLPLNMTARFCLGLLLFVVFVGAEEDEHVFGKTNVAFCPVTFTKLHLSHSTTFVDFRYGQRVYVLNEASAELYRKEPRKYFMGPYDEPLEGKDGYRGLPDMHNQTVRCPVTNTSFVVKQMSSPRIMMKQGQFVYFCCMDCMMKFFKDPGKYIIGAGPEASDFQHGFDKAKMQRQTGDNVLSKDKENNQIAVTIVATIFVLLSIESLFFIAYILVSKSKPASIVRFFKLSTGHDQDNEDCDISLAKVSVGSQQERYTDDV